MLLGGVFFPGRRLRAAFLLLAAGAGLAPAAEQVYVPPTVPSGENPAIFPVSREEWRMRVQANFDKVQGRQVDLVFDGDSITDAWQLSGKGVWDARYGKLNAFDFGIGGDRTQHLLWRLRQGQLDGLDPKLVVLMIGTNNLGADTPAQIAEGVEADVDEYLRRAPHARILLLGIFPRGERPDHPLRSPIAAVNGILSGLVRDRVTYLDIGPKFLDGQGVLSRDIMPDQTHPNEKGYRIWADAIQAEIDKAFPPSVAP